MFTFVDSGIGHIRIRKTIMRIFLVTAKPETAETAMTVAFNALSLTIIFHFPAKIAKKMTKNVSPSYYRNRNGYTAVAGIKNFNAGSTAMMVISW